MRLTYIARALGRPSNNLKGGIVGLANVGKSTFFQALTRSELGNPANFPFATIDPEKALVKVPSSRFENLCSIYKPASKVPASLTVFDIAGLVKGAAKGEGLGNAFLNHIRAVDGLFQVVRDFTDSEITHTEGSVNAVRDLDIILDELMLKDMELVESFNDQLRRTLRPSTPTTEKLKLREQLDVGEKVLQWLEQGRRVANGVWTADEETIINVMSLLTAKPCVYIVNVGEEEYAFGSEETVTEKHENIQNWVDKNSPGDPVIQVAVNLEHRLASLTPEKAQEEMQELAITSALPEAIMELRKRLGLISFFTCGSDEVREWTIRKGTKAPEAAGVIHQDLEKSFIFAQITDYQDALDAQGDEKLLREQGKVQQRGKDYQIQDGDIIYFKTASSKR